MADTSPAASNLDGALVQEVVEPDDLLDRARTLALQIAERLGALYVSGEESPGQLKRRARRIGVDPGYF